ncbi:hypothetical protein [Natrinema halophilum]|uniref:Uncharacterized protein n=1 Tax=Natrinema halophilum TaxID=1699371 RepID=A0A7D5GM02_9EURY|nr:hypothetical protein [Natrinema halophilum]QLG49732.1 hypothetical protein HYG82_13105 [Natrinema halophilum]
MPSSGTPSRQADRGRSVLLEAAAKLEGGDLVRRVTGNVEFDTLCAARICPVSASTIDDDGERIGL